MKKMVMVGVAAVLLAGASQASSWRLFEIADQQESAYFIDKSAIKRDGEYVTAWVMSVSGASVVTERSSKMLLRAFCKRDLIQLLAIYNYSDEGKALSSNASPTAPQPVVPDTIMESAANHMCGKSLLKADVFSDPVRITKLFFEEKRNAVQAPDTQ